MALVSRRDQEPFLCCCLQPSIPCRHRWTAEGRRFCASAVLSGGRIRLRSSRSAQILQIHSAQAVGGGLKIDPAAFDAVFFRITATVVAPGKTHNAIDDRRARSYVRRGHR